MKSIKCPQCQKPSVWDDSNPSKPFCSDRCTLIDLGAWASEEYKVAVQPSLDEYEEFSTGMDSAEKAFTPTMH